MLERSIEPLRRDRILFACLLSSVTVLCILFGGSIVAHRMLFTSLIEKIAGSGLWGNWWHVCMGILLVSSAFWSGWELLRITWIKFKLKIVRQERERLARELHDTVIQGCTGISVLLEAMASVKANEEASNDDLLDRAREQALRTIDEARSAVWNLRSTQKEVDLVLVLRDLAAQIAHESGSLVEVEHNIVSLPLPPYPADEISMTVREALRNAVQHSGTKRVMVDLRSNRRILRVSVHDFGCGLSAAKKSPDVRHYGILGMHERMRRLGGGLQIDEIPGTGTTVRLMLRWGVVRNAGVRS